MINLTDIINAFLALLAAVITAFVIPWIKAKTTVQQQEKIAGVYRTLVFAAEQIFGGGNGKEKLDYVKAKLEEKGYTVDIDMIEATVKSYYGHWNYEEEKITSPESAHPPEVTA